MSGHSKWAGIKHKKAANDAKRGNLFTKLANSITVAAKQGGGKPEFNPTLRIAIEAARSANMPKDNIERAIKRGTGELGGAIVEELIYEAFGPSNVAIIVEALTDNRNRTNADVRTLLAKHGGRNADSGSVTYQYDKRGVIRLDLANDQRDKFEELVIEGGAEDYILGDGFAVVFTDMTTLHKLRDLIEAAGYKPESAKVEWIAKNAIELDDEALEKVSHLLDLLDENDDITNVYTNIAE